MRKPIQSWSAFKWLCIALILLSLSSLAMPKFLVWNASASVDKGLYLVEQGAGPRRLKLAVFMPPPMLAEWLEQRNYIGSGVPLLKPIASRTGDRFCRSGNIVTRNGAPIAFALNADRQGRRLPVWQGCRFITDDEIFLLSRSKNSLDSRYFGPLPMSGLQGRAYPIWTLGNE